MAMVPLEVQWQKIKLQMDSETILTEFTVECPGIGGILFDLIYFLPCWDQIRGLARAGYILCH
jgi:hypothetical protein